MSQTTIRMDSTQIVQYLKCPQMHNFISVQNLVRKRETRDALNRGTLMHGLLERYYKKIAEKCPPASAMSFSLTELNELKKEITLPDGDYKKLAVRFIDYYAKYQQDKIEILMKDNIPAVEIGFSVPIRDDADFLFVLEGKIDLITIMSGCLVVWDHKYQGREYLLYGHSIQALNYCLATGANRFMYNYIRGHEKIQPNTFDRKLTTISTSLLTKWHRKLNDIFIQRATHVLHDVTLNEFPNQTCSDAGYGKRCPYTSLCECENENVRKLLIERDYEKKKEWEPWSLEVEENEDAI